LEESGVKRLGERLVRRPLAGAALAALVAVGVYVPSLQNGFTYDDRVVVVENRFITDFGNVSSLASPEYFARAEEKSWRPVTTLTYFFDHALWGKRPVGYHLTNVALHAVAASLVVFLLAAWRAPPWVALAGGLLFAVHPVATAVVEAVAFRDDLLAALFVVAGLVAYRAATREDRPSTVGLALAPLLYAAACLSKENAIVLPALAWALDVVVDGRPLAPRDRRRAVALGALAVVGLAYLGLRFGPMAGPAETFRYLDGSPRVAAVSAPAVLFRAALLLVVPLGLSPVRWVEPVHSMADPLAVAGLSLVIGGVALGWLSRRRAPRATAALLWMVVAWLPVSGVVPLTHPLADRYLYLPLVGFAWLAAEGVGVLGRRDDRLAQSGAVAVTAAVLVAASLLTMARHAAWRDELSLWRTAVASEPTSYRAHFNLGDALEKAGRLGEAEAAYRRALALKPVFSHGHYNLGRLLYKAGRKAEAAEQFRAALDDRPDYAEAHNHLGVIFAEQGELERARAAYESALATDPSNANAMNNLGILSARAGRSAEAERFFRRATAANPYDPTGFANLGVMLAQLGRTSEAERAFLQALALNPNFGPARRGLAGLRGAARR
jgi:Flp pilus assembly protein TadD